MFRAGVHVNFSPIIYNWSKIIIFVKNHSFREKLQISYFLSKIQNFVKKSNFSSKNPNFRHKSKFLSKIQIFVKTPNFRQKSKFSSKILIFVKNPNFCQKNLIFRLEFPIWLKTSVWRNFKFLSVGNLKRWRNLLFKLEQ